jgi:hypothetical protein
MFNHVLFLELVIMVYFPAGKINLILQKIFFHHAFLVVEMFNFFLNKKLMIVVNVVQILSMVSNVLWQII